MSQQITKFFSNSKNIYLLIIVAVVILVSTLYIFTKLEIKDITTNRVQETNTTQNSNTSQNEEPNFNTSGEILPGVEEPEPPSDIPEQTILPIN